ncbi:MAG: VCBS repeat-containing protein [Candidatus Thiodiazotropha sp. (ex Myrtea spinifera)]|nr:VCBS repeat-containing protein [Candidatus Thiodiazotropha sp. (ex Myrtea spinifera)]
MPVRSYTPTYSITPTTSQSRIESFKECAGNGNCLPQTSFSYAGGQLVELGFDSEVTELTSGLFTKSQGWTEADTPRMMADVDGDGLQDIVGFSPSGVVVRLSSGQLFTTLPDFGKSHGWDTSKHLRMMADVNGDGLSDVVGFYSNGVYYSLSEGNGFSPKTPWITGKYGYDAGGWRVDKHIRTLADVDGDGKLDIIGIGDNNVQVTLASGEAFWPLIGFGASSWDIEKNPRVIVDVNGDGLADIIGFGNDGVKVAYSQGHSFSVPSLVLDEFIQSSAFISTSYWTYVSIVFPLTWNLTDKWQMREVVDVNGDGLVDIVGFGINGVDVSLSTGDGFLEPVQWIDKYGVNTGEAYVYNRKLYSDSQLQNLMETIYGWAKIKHPRRMVDINGDGRIDIVGFADDGVYASLSLGDSFSEPFKWLNGMYGHTTWPSNTYLAKDFPRMLGDINGDGLADIVGFDQSQVVSNINLLPYAGYLVQIEDGNSIQTDIEYQSIAGPNDHYTKGSDANLAEEIDLQIPLHVVTKVSTSNGINGTNSITYKYGGLKANKKGRGLLGFEWLETQNQQTLIRNKTTFSQTFPHIGTPLNTWTETSGGVRLNETTSTPATKLLNADKTIFPYLSETQSTEKDLNNTLIKTETVYNDLYDNYGNIETMRTAVSGGGKTFETTNTNTYTNNTVNHWHLGRLTESSVEQKVTDTQTGLFTTSTRTSAFSYDSDTGLLMREVIEPGNPTLELITDYLYEDGFGNKTQSKVTGSGLTEPRITKTQYDTAGRYPVWTKNAKNHQEDYVHHPLCGKKTKLTGPNGLDTDWTYDDFCRQLTETRADGTQSTIQRYRVLDGTRYAARPAGMSPSVELYPLANVHYKIVTTSTGTAPVTVYYDQLGRELRKETVGFDNKVIYQDTEYNALGQVQRASRRYFVGDPIHWVNFQYDLLGRVARQDAPADYGSRAITKTVYSGLVTTLTDAKGRVTTSTKDVSGKVVRVDQPDGAFVINRYDPYGNLTETEDAKGNIVSMFYDDRGRKISMDDPDMGHWEYDYNAAGELVWQKDAKNQEVTMHYDVLGRMTSRIEAEGTTTWAYDTEAYGEGKLASVTAPGGYSKSLTYEEKGRVKTSKTTIDGDEYTITNDYDPATGRLIKVTRPNGFEVENVYDSNGYLLAKRSPANQVTDYQKQHLLNLQDEAAASATAALLKAQQYAADAAYYEQWADTYRTEVATNADVQVLTAEVAALQRHKSYKLYINQATGEQYLESPDRVMILHGEIDTPIMIPPAAHYQIIVGSNSEWTLQAVDLDTWSASVLPNLTDSGDHAFFGDYNGDDTTDYIRSAQSVDNPLYDSALLERLGQTASEIKYVSNTLWNLADDALARATQLIAVAGQVDDRLRQAELWADNSDGEDLTEMGNAASGHITYWQANTRDAELRLTGFRQGNGLVTLRDYDTASGHLMGIQSGFEYGSNIRELEYHYDVMDNVTSRYDRVQGASESFLYDNLDRLKKNSVSGSLSGISYSYATDYEYDLTGNILYKSDVGHYAYGTASRNNNNAGPAALLSAGTGHTNYQYDLNGNVIAGGGRIFQWTSFNKPKELQKGTALTKFRYGPDRARFRKEANGTEVTHYIGKLYERIDDGNHKITHKHFIYAGGELAAIQIKTVDNTVAQPDQTRYMHTDALGSVDTITDGFGQIVDRMGFDPFGMRRGGNWNNDLPISAPVLTNRGFTGHEHVDEMGIIHMNGRIYDPELGRFLSADPNIQAPLNSQSHNRYSYVWNNPLKYTDPSGFFLKKLFKKVKRFVKKWGRTILSIAVMFIPGVNVMVAGFLSGMIASGGDLRAGVIGALTAGAFNLAGGLAKGSFSNALAHGVIGGVRSKLMGGRFVDGFVSGAFGSFANPVGDGFSWGGLARAVVAGGVGSVLGGGKFKNGAITATFGYMFNQARHAAVRNHRGNGKFIKAVSEHSLKVAYNWKPGESILVSMYRPLRALSEVVVHSYDSITNLAHEQLVWLKPDGSVDNLGYGPGGFDDEVINFSKSVFGEATVVPIQIAKPLDHWQTVSGFYPAKYSIHPLGWRPSGYGFLNYNCQKAANWYHDYLRGL